MSTDYKFTGDTQAASYIESGSELWVDADVVDTGSGWTINGDGTYDHAGAIAGRIFAASVALDSVYRVVFESTSATGIVKLGSGDTAIGYNAQYIKLGYNEFYLTPLSVDTEDRVSIYETGVTTISDVGVREWDIVTPDAETGVFGIRFENNDIAFANGADEVSQNSQIRLQMIKGEQFDDSRVGMPWLTDMVNPQVSIAAKRQLIRNTILSTPNIRSLDSLVIGVDDVSGEATAEFSGTTISGEEFGGVI